MDEKVLKEELDLRKEIQVRLNKIKKIKRKIKDLGYSMEGYEAEIKDLEEDIKKLQKKTK
jgi:peptidoglycan hydrolase CwlO-like protein